jgi:anti-sigma factor RsiW
MSCAQVEPDLDAYLDRELDEGSSKAVRDHLGECAACRREVAEREALARLVRAAPYYSAPARLRHNVLALAAHRSVVRRVLPWAAAAILVIAAGAGTSLLQSGVAQSEAISDEAVSSHVRSLMADHLFDVRSADQHTVKPWFLGKLDFSPPVVDLATLGFPLVGGRVDYFGGHPVAALVYERRQHTINVFVLPVNDDANARASVRTIRGFHVRRWSHGGMNFWAVSDLNEAELTQFCQTLESSIGERR